MSARRVQDSVRSWPVVTIALIAINVALFVIMHPTLEVQQAQIADAKIHILMLAAEHPGLDVPPDVGVLISKFGEQNPDSWRRLQQLDRPINDEWDGRTRGITNEATLQTEMDALVGQYQASDNTTFGKYVVTPSAPTALAYITASFLHSSWKTLFGAMLTLLLAGWVLEDGWGRVIYTAFFFAACAVALQIRGWTEPQSLAPVMGASGAVAMMMGALLVRFPLKMLRVQKVQIPAVCFGPVWLAVEVLVNWKGLNRDYARVFEQPVLRSYAISVAAAFVFGAAAAIVFRYLRVERHHVQVSLAHVLASSAAIEGEQLIETGDYNRAEAVLKGYLKLHPDATDALMVLQQVYYCKNEMPDYQATTATLCRAYIKERDSQAAWQSYEEYLNAGGQDMPAATWVELCRIAEERQLFERAVSECEKLAAKWPNTRESLMAQLKAAKLCLKQLARPGEALQMFEAAYCSPIPHLDFEQAISTGLRESKMAIAAAGRFPVMD